MNDPQVRLRMRGVSKRFGATVALDGVDLVARRGEVHALVGENGAGKSTLMKVLAGALAPEAGTIELDGAPYDPRSPARARSLGVAMIYQELTLAPHLSVAENILLGVERHRGGWISWPRVHREVREVLEVLEHPEIRPGETVGRLGVSAQQLVEVGRALVSDARVIIFDEPTSSLTRRDTELLFEVIRRLRERGVCVLYISHFLEEVQEISDSYTVLRDGKTVARGEMADTTLDAIIEHMVGRSVEEMFPRVPHSIGEPILELQELCGERAPRDVDLTLHRGEILGIAGLVGAGRTEMLRAVFGLDPVVSGRVRLAALGDITHRGTRWKIEHGVGLLSENRKEEGLLLNLSIADNVALGGYGRLSRRGWISRRAQTRATGRQLEALRVKASSPLEPVGRLSGGNQQKVALARLLHLDVDVLLLDEPTRGVDVGSKVQIYELMGELARRGKSILFVSSYLPELLGVADRIAVMNRGRLCEPRDVGALDEEIVMRLATVGEEEPGN